MIRRIVGCSLLPLAAVAVAVVLTLRWYGQTPPALGASSPGTVRLGAPCCSGAPAAPTTVTLAHGIAVRLQYGDSSSVDGRPEAQISVAMEPGDRDSRLLRLHEGDVQTFDGVTLHILHIWLTPNTAHHAVDVQVTQG